MATAVRPPGYYTSWLHVITNIPSTQNLDLYDWIGDWTERNYGHRWTNTSKKLNAILTIPNTSIISASNYTDVKLNSAITPGNITPALLITTQFRSFDRITLINRGKIIGSYGFRDYGGSTSFTPPDDVISTKNTINTHKVTTVSLSATAGGGRGGNGTNNFSGAGGGGGGAGGRCIVNNVTVEPGVQIIATGGGAGQGAKFAQNTKSLAHASAGSPGGNPSGGNQEGYCKAKGPFGECYSGGNRDNAPTPGAGGAGGSNLITARKNGNNGSKGGSGGQRYYGERSGVAGGAGGVGIGGNGGVGGNAYNGNDRNGANGLPGSLAWSYVQKQLFGPAIRNLHTNIRLINDDGEIAGGYSDGQTIYAVYGASLFDSTETDWNGPNNNGTIFPTVPGLQP